MSTRFDLKSNPEAAEAYLAKKLEPYALVVGTSRVASMAKENIETWSKTEKYKESHTIDNSVIRFLAVESFTEISKLKNEIEELKKSIPAAVVAAIEEGKK